jgi:hypothetical protein
MPSLTVEFRSAANFDPWGSVTIRFQENTPEHFPLHDEHHKLLKESPGGVSRQASGLNFTEAGLGAC